MIQLLLRLMFATAHDGLPRGAELFSAIHVKDWDWSQEFCSVTLHLHRSKCCRKGGGEHVYLVIYQTKCAADLLSSVFDYYYLWLKSEAFVFPPTPWQRDQPPTNDVCLFV